MTGDARIIRGNALDLPLADESVDLVVTSPPYFALRSYRDGGEHYDGQIGAEPTPEQFVDALLAATREMMRVLKPSGSIFVNLGDKYAGSAGWCASDASAQSSTLVDKGRQQRQTHGETPRAPSTNARPKSLIGVPWRYAIRCIDELGLILRAEIVWAKPNGLPESVTDRVRRSHEQWFHFTKQPRYFSAIDEIREEHKGGGAGVSTDERKAEGWAPNRGTASGTQKRVTFFAGNPLGRLPGSVWTVPTEPLKVDPALGVDHFAAFPTEWPRRIILGWCPPEGVVLDPFSGTGTTAGVAKALGRIGIGVDMSADYCRLAEWRTNGVGYERIERRVHERTYGKAKPKRAPKPEQPEQPDLFGGETA